MKRAYEKPMAEKIEFDYRNQVVASGCTLVRSNESFNVCDRKDDKPSYQI